ncbi:MAG TPA: hypothetical protein VL727_07620 [Puia sp.]|jgi:hypothetical protein|nr:hypothetical protein [Puia sp.]
MRHFSTISELHRANNYRPPENPLISLIRCDKGNSCPIADSEFTSDFYMIRLKKTKSGTYKNYSALSFAGPRQVVEIRGIETEENGLTIYFHEDLLIGHPLRQVIGNFSYFDRDSYEAMRLSAKEEQIIWELFNKIESECHSNQDEYTRGIMLSHIESILKYAQRFYKRQFISG